MRPTSLLPFLGLPLSVLALPIASPTSLEESLTGKSSAHTLSTRMFPRPSSEPGAEEMAVPKEGSQTSEIVPESSLQTDSLAYPPEGPASIGLDGTRAWYSTDFRRLRDQKEKELYAEMTSDLTPETGSPARPLGAPTSIGTDGAHAYPYPKPTEGAIAELRRIMKQREQVLNSEITFDPSTEIGLPAHPLGTPAYIGLDGARAYAPPSEAAIEVLRNLREQREKAVKAGMDSDPSIETASPAYPPEAATYPAIDGTRPFTRPHERYIAELSKLGADGGNALTKSPGDSKI